MKAGLTKEQIEKTVGELYADPVLALRMLLPTWFPDTIPWFHRGIIAIILRRTDFLEKYGDVDKIIENFIWREDPWDEKSPKQYLFSRGEDGRIHLKITKHTLILLPRGFSKTTLLNGLIIYMILFKLKRYIVYASESSTHAETQLQNVKKHLSENELIAGLWGQLEPPKGGNLRWTNEFIQTLSGFSMLARGSGSQIRGTNVDAVRPDLMLFDDIEDRKEIQNDALRHELKKWVLRDALPALPRRDKDAFAVVLGTLMHSDSVMVTLSKDPRFNTIVFAAVDAKGEALWKEHMNLEAIEQEKGAFAAAGDLAGFYMEFFNKVRAPEGAKFPGPFIYSPVQGEQIVRGLAIDPALSSAKTACDCVLAVVARSIKNGRTWVEDLVGRKGMTPREQVDTYFELSSKYNVDHHGVEAIAYQTALVHLLREEMFRKGKYFEITEIKHGIRKEVRIEGILQPRYRNGYIHHVRPFRKLETQLLDWPNGGFDWPDVVAMAIALLDPYAASVADEDLDLEADEYPELEGESYQWAP
jgi:hypothetical protein